VAEETSHIWPLLAYMKMTQQPLSFRTGVVAEPPHSSADELGFRNGIGMYKSQVVSSA
jgi:hypothetical protein